jgi:MBOAT, membrane-bound O-acyltransferase family
MGGLSLVRAGSHLLVVVTIRLLPFVSAYVLGRHSPLRMRLLVAGLFLPVPLLACVVGASNAVVALLLAQVYFVAISLGSNTVSRAAAAVRLPRVLLFVAIFAAYVGVPALCCPRVGVATVVVLGCEIGLSSYSYCVETGAAGGRIPALRDCLFFLLVNPTLAYSDRGVFGATADENTARGWRRAAYGIGLMGLNLALLEPCAHLLHKKGLTEDSALFLVAFGVADLLSLYCAHVALAHLQIGCMRQMGWRVPERYLAPLSSTAPLEFWRRWNTYLYTWLKLYVFLPIGRAAYRRTGWAVVPMFAAIATLMVSGIIHSAVASAGRASVEMRPLAFFIAAGVFIVAWSTAMHLLRGLRERVPAWACDTVGRVAVTGGLVAAVVAWA